jgi:hypothetical protein
VAECERVLVSRIEDQHPRRRQLTLSIPTRLGHAIRIART